MELIRDVAADRYAQLEVNALVQRVVVTNHHREAAEELASRWMQLTPDEILESPCVLIGTVDEVIEDLQNASRALGHLLLCRLRALPGCVRPGRRPARRQISTGQIHPL
jgi:hypothetical protein